MTTTPPRSRPSIRTRILLVEDDERIRQAVGMALDDLGFEIIDAATGEEALEQLDQLVVDVVLLDLMLPGMDGLTVCQILRSRGDLPIIIVSARTDTADVIEGLEAGADDFMTKPLVASELAARIKALLRRRRPTGEVPVESRRRIGDLEIWLNEGVVRRSGTEIRLTRTEFRLLAELASADGHTVTREDLLQRVWGYDYFGDTRLLDVHVRRLRRKIEQDPDVPTLLVTVRGVGYRIETGKDPE